ncbi:MAG: family 43 glycosylhydrolase [Prevotella sp.]|nr:family 43 glycosylhydrolase [Prevotella sp.]
MPVVQTKFSADPAPMVYDGKVFLYTTHDEDDARGYEFKMKDWLLYTSEDMVNWQDHGAVASLKDFKWYDGDNGAWAEQVIERNGKFYMYCPIHGHGIGVLVADSPYGPFHDPIGQPLVWQKDHWYDIDPSVWIDADGQAYMYWGNPHTYYVKLNDDMISTSGDIVQLPHIQDYQEGPWIYKKDSHYYLAFASTCCPEGIGYAMSDKITGPWEYKGHVMNHTYKTRGNHPGIIDYKGHSYVFGLNYDLLRLITDEHSERRSVSCAEMRYNADGTIQELPYFRENVLEAVGTFNPFRKVEAETMYWGWGLKTKESATFPKSIQLCNIDNGESLTLRNVDFGSRGARKFMANIASVKAGSIIEIHLDNAEGQLVGTLKVPQTGSLDSWKTASCKMKGANGVHDLVFVFKGTAGNDLFLWDWWSMEKSR